MNAHGSVPPEVRETIDLWISDFLDRPAGAETAAHVGPDAVPVLVAFLEAACHAGKTPAEIEAPDVAHALLDHVATLAVPPEKRWEVPDLIGTFLEDLEGVGRLSGGRALSAQVRVLAPTYRERAAGKGQTVVRAAPKIGRNAPCPCGSGKKYKHCCLRTLGE